MNSNIDSFILKLSENLPARKIPKVGRHPIDKKTILSELFKLCKTNCGWRNINHKTVCYEYFKIIQRRGLLKQFFNLITSPEVKRRPKKTIVDSSDWESYRTNGLVKYSGKYHNYCMRMSIEITPEYVPVNINLSKGSAQDSNIIEKILNTTRKLPYEMYLDRGYEKFERRRKLKKKNCQVRMEMLKRDKNKKRGPKFRFTQSHKLIRQEIEKVYGWVKSFMIMRFNRLRKLSNIRGVLIFVISYYTWLKLN